ncbi:hypothetical protein Pyn_21671 [Prunus yedoensis var. nudiflora]|uniref:Uncharacterized protein n=1 Tax=Prunus yedoensis var. nudiflora TaxID=2094558 RepID=A0A314XZG0_PRUYE|nr:hypothetical protein Pyn_21671 [Prunus yedoensis var. nudiflora]
MSSQNCSGQTSELVQFPQPTRPINSYKDMTSSMALPQPTRPIILDNMTCTNSEPYLQKKEARLPQEFVDHVNLAPPTEEEDKEALHGLLEIISELREKVPAKLADHLRDMDGTKALPTVLKGSTASRGLEGVDLSKKLERFKIRTFDSEGVVKEEQKR